MTDFAELHLKPALRERYALPDIGYPVPIARQMELLTDDHDLDLAELLFWLQQHSSAAAGDFRRYEPAMARLAAPIAPEDDHRDLLTVMGEEWWLELGPVDLDSEIVSVQRDDELVAAIATRDTAGCAPPPSGRSTPRVPLGSSHSAQNPHPDGGVCMRDNNWEYAKDASAGMGQVYAAEAGTSYLSDWQFGLGSCTTAPRARSSVPTARSLRPTRRGRHRTRHPLPADVSRRTVIPRRHTGARGGCKMR